MGCEGSLLCLQDPGHGPIQSQLSPINMTPAVLLYDSWGMKHKRVFAECT